MCRSIKNMDKSILCMVQYDALVLDLHISHYDPLVPISVERADPGVNTSIVICVPATTYSISNTQIDESVATTTSSSSNTQIGHGGNK